MKRLLSVILLLVALLLFVSCDLFIPKVEERTLAINVGGATSRGTTSRGTTMFSDDLALSVKIRIFYGHDDAPDTTPEGTLVDGSSSIFTKLDDHWHGTFTYTPSSITDEVFIHAMAFTGDNGTGEIKYQGTTETQIIGNFETYGTIVTETGYVVGDRGPGGGWVIYNKGSFDNNTNDSSVSKMGKSWRYIEIAAQDLEEEWEANDPYSGDGRLDDTVKVSTAPGQVGKVYKKDLEEIAENLVLDTTSFYWGKNGSFLTSPTLADGNLNTTKIDAMTTATPGIGRKGNGRKASGDNTNLRRDTAKILKAEPINLFSDWFIPAKEALKAIYDNKGEVTLAHYSLTDGTYWTSSEDPDADNDQYAWSVDFSKDTSADATVSALRDTTYKIRPARAF